MLELAADEVADGDQAAVGAVATGARLGGLDQAVHGLDKAVGEAGAEVLDESGEVLTQRGAKTLEGFQARAPRPGDPGDQLALGVFGAPGLGEQGAQGFLQAPGARRLQAGALQVMHQSELALTPAAGVLERGPAAALEFGPGLDLGPTHLFEGGMGQGHNVEGIEAQGRLRTLLAG